jgi:3-phosphoshikimate 1-carboxyvinyltransferase
MATAAAVLGLRVPGVVVEDVGTVGKTLPDFVALWEAMVRGGHTHAASA